jgi:hypothetical protein
MKANELRLGNLLQDKVTKSFLIVTDLSESAITTKVIDRTNYPLPDGWQAEPIYLTPEILGKAGFVYVSDKTFESKKFDIWVSEANGKYTFTGRPDGGLLIEFTHQLQNLIFALTGEELNIQL